MRRTYGQKTVNKPQSIPGGPQRHTNLIAEGHDPGPTPGLKPVKTDGRIGSTTPPSYLKGGLTVDNNSDAQSHTGTIGAAAAEHMSVGHKGDVWSPRASRARKMAKPNPKEYANPVNAKVPNRLVKTKPE